MTTEQKHPAPDENVDEPTEEDILRENPPPPTWKHPDDGTTLSERDEERPLQP
ncbi:MULTISPECIES: hypothetical protein [unclassified Pseudomonas]|uniref:hypothetical protein n=1 Tax=unclassified Pseudomonas TaxID=196821 RepID=UPI002AC8B25E|nr:MULTISPECIES: hypothetical protein [unclassified Pseudomonas]MEB0048496.1 hypothetical protein [Pseudomonas sp. Dout3]MEB0099359.1 hypothetical protein [Pseudomonas sp. DC1.2]WPX61173.1 hypothetical protein RHM68_11215 [Pseudomonas sp. DC1.2]